MRKALFLFLSFLFIGVVAMAQKTVSGKIIDANGIPLAGVSVKSKKTGNLTSTAADGSFRLSVASDDELEISSVGYKTQTISAANPVINIKLEQSIEELSQVVLVGTRRAGRVKTETTAPVDVINVGQATALPAGWICLLYSIMQLLPLTTISKVVVMVPTMWTLLH
ncbi:MAG: carboxypeptidase-like regulatory domain-containing protein [Chitinophagaceae bacterium]|nr:carboxypeptidase-like regulatory domain-containing protein [Chitinophagaceae bacterium]